MYELVPKTVWHFLLQFLLFPHHLFLPFGNLLGGGERLSFPKLFEQFFKKRCLISELNQPTVTLAFLFHAL